MKKLYRNINGIIIQYSKYLASVLRIILITTSQILIYLILYTILFTFIVMNTHYKRHGVPVNEKEKEQALTCSCISEAAKMDFAANILSKRSVGIFSPVL